MRLVEQAFVLIFLWYRGVPSACRAFSASTRVTRPAKYPYSAPFSPTSCFRNYVVSRKFARTGYPVWGSSVAWTDETVLFDVTLDELLAACESFHGRFFPCHI